MGKRSKISSDGILEEDTLVDEGETSYNSKRVLLRNKFPARISVRGPVTGELYKVESAGEQFEVDERDVPGLLLKTVGNTVCCGSSTKNFIFEVGG